MLTVPDAARRAGRDPETVRRWIRTGRLRSTKVGTQHLVDEQDLEALLAGDEELEVPSYLRRTPGGQEIPNVVRWVRRTREGR